MELKVLGDTEVVNIHDSILAKSGGLPGLSLNKSLASALHRIDSHITYAEVTDIYEIAALYAIVIAQGHVFNDGNKRTAMISMVNFLLLNNVVLSVSNPAIEDKMVRIAEKKVTCTQLTAWIKKHSAVIDSNENVVSN